MMLPGGLCRRSRAFSAAAVVVGVLAWAGGLEGQRAADQGVYLRVGASAAGTYDATVQAVRGAVASAGWTVLADYDAGVNRKRCEYRGRVFVVNWPEYATAAVRDGIQGAFAAALRLEVFEDEGGVHVAAVNPRSVNRTIVAEEGRDAEWARLTERLETVLHGAAAGATSQYGQRRDRGRIGRTMGVMAGGPFGEKVKTLVTVQSGPEGARGLARHLYQGLERQAAAGEWRLRPVYVLEASPTIFVVGVTGEPVESKSFDIVGPGADGSRKSMRCPGLDHAAAYPLELVLVQEGQAVHVRTVDEMYRMKLYFEDAGMMAFAKNMGMPGSIGDELKAKVRAALGVK